MENSRKLDIAWYVPESSFSTAAAQQLLSPQGIAIHALAEDETLPPSIGLVVLHSARFADLEQLHQAYDRLSLPSLIVVNSADEETRVLQWPNLPIEVDVCRADALHDQLISRLNRLREALNGEFKAHAGALRNIHSREYLDERLPREFANAYKHCRSLSISLMKLERPAETGDEHGGASADQVLKAFAETVSANVRIVDWLARYDDDEFCLVMPDTWLDEGRDVVERIRNAIAVVKIGAAEGHDLSLSIGVAELTDHEADHAALLRKAETALKKAESEGGNRVSVEIS